MKPTTSVSWRYLGPNPRSCYKQLFIRDTRIRARTLYGMFMSAEEPMTAEEIAAEFHLPVDAVNEAIAYCKGDPPEIAQDLEREKRFMEGSGMNDPDYKFGGKFKIMPPEEIVRILNT